MKYVKKPIVIEAFQFGVDEYPEWFKPGCIIGTPHDDDYICSFVSLGEAYIARKYEMIIKDGADIYPQKKDIFDASYEAFKGK
jgi:hypothetical protein